MYSAKTPAPVYCTECWNGDGWDPFSYGREYDFSRPFFSQLKDLFNVTPRNYSYRFGNLINSEFTNFSKDNRNVYLSFGVIGCEDVLYSEIIDYSKNSMDCFTSEHLEGCYENVDSDLNYNTHFAIKSRSCIDSYFLYDCANSSHCALSSNLRNQQYVFKNQKMSKEEYERAITDIELNTYSGMQRARATFDQMMKNEAIHKYSFIYASKDAEGDHIHNAKNVKDSFDVNDSEDVSYANRVLFAKDSFDCSGSGFSELTYECMAATESTYMDFFCYITIQGSRLCQYSLILRNCSNCFGCVGLTNKEYCIFNKQYTKEEYEELVPKIKEQMSSLPYVDEKGRTYRYGEYFPFDMCPFGYNETNVFDFFPLSKEEALSKGYNWVEREGRNYNITKQGGELPDDIKDVSDQVLEEIIACPNNGDPMSQCTEAFRIMTPELSFYRQKNLPLPRYCPNCRHYMRLKYRGPMRLYKRECNCVLENHNHNSKCGNTFKTPYAPERTERVYCESCYNKEVY